MIREALGSPLEVLSTLDVAPKIARVGNVEESLEFWKVLGVIQDVLMPIEDAAFHDAGERRHGYYRQQVLMIGTLRHITFGGIYANLRACERISVRFGWHYQLALDRFAAFEQLPWRWQTEFPLAVAAVVLGARGMTVERAQLAMDWLHGFIDGYGERARKGRNRTTLLARGNEKPKLEGHVIIDAWSFIP